MAINKYQLFVMLHDGADVIQAEDETDVEMLRNMLSNTELSFAERDLTSTFPKYYMFSDDGFIEASGEDVREDLVSCGNAFLPVLSFSARMEDFLSGEDILDHDRT